MTVFLVDAATIAMAHGCVSCSQCGATFDTMATLTDSLPEEPFEVLDLNPPSSAPPLLLQAVGHTLPPQQSLFAAETSEDELSADAAPTAKDHYNNETTSILGRHLGTAVAHHRPSSRHLIWVCVALGMVLVAQLAWAERSVLVRHPSTATLMRGACQMFGCRLPLSRDLAKLELVSRDIRRHPSVPDALIISATLRNDADFTQPWPVVSIVLSDLDDRRVAMRRFRPAEYLHDPATRDKGLAAGSSAALVFEVHDPGSNAVAFEFSFQ